MKNIEKSLKKQIVSNERSAGGRKMRISGVSDPRFARMDSKEMFPQLRKAKNVKVKKTNNPSKDLKPLKKMKGAQK